MAFYLLARVFNRHGKRRVWGMLNLLMGKQAHLILTLHFYMQILVELVLSYLTNQMNH